MPCTIVVRTTPPGCRSTSGASRLYYRAFISLSSCWIWWVRRVSIFYEVLMSLETFCRNAALWTILCGSPRTTVWTTDREWPTRFTTAIWSWCFPSLEPKTRIWGSWCRITRARIRSTSPLINYSSSFPSLWRASSAWRMTIFRPWRRAR